MKLLIFLLSISAIACTSNSNADYLEYVDGKQLLNLNEIQRNGDKLEIPEIAAIIPDSIFVDDHVKIQITLNSNEFTIVKAFYDCDTVAIPLIDTALLKVNGCDKKLLVQKDTINIHYVPTSKGKRNFREILILTLDKQSIYRTYKHNFSYEVFN